MNADERDIQHKIEQGAQPASADERTYQKLFEVLAKEPPYHVSISFADSLIAKIDSKKSLVRDYMWLGAGIILAVMGVVVTLTLVSWQWTFGQFTFLSTYSGLVIFAIAFVVALQVLDKKILRNRSL